MSQNQSYFWQTTRHNVYLKRTAKLHMLLALMAVMTFATICAAEHEPKFSDDNGVTLGAPTKLSADDNKYGKDDTFDAPPKEALIPADPTEGASTIKASAGFIDAFTASISVILLTELGDKTFFIAAIMAMRHPRLIVFAGAISALALMTVLSVVFGMAATIIPKVYTYYISTALFAIFGLKMIYEGYFMKATDAQEELEEVQSDLRKREDEYIRSKRAKYDDAAEAKRKNSNSDKEENDDSGAGADANISNSTAVTVALANAKANNNKSIKHPEMQQHRQRKQLNNYKTNNNNNNNNNNNGCDSSNNDSDDGLSGDGEVFLNGGIGGDTLKMSTFHSSPTLSASALSNQTNQTNCDEFNNSPNKLTFKANNNNDSSPISKQRRVGAVAAVLANGNGNGNINGGGDPTSAMVHSVSASGALMNHHAKTNGGGGASAIGDRSNSINSISSLGNNKNNSAAAAAGQPSDSELKQVGGNKKRLERDVTAALVQDPESGVVRKNTKKSATYLTTRVLMQAFTMTFLAEWGDRSQLTTIILAASKDVYGVIAGGIIGHSICTGLAVIGGRIVAAKISVRTVTIVGGIVFLGFALYALIVRPDDI